jgi:hypothetical protein
LDDHLLLVVVRVDDLLVVLLQIGAQGVPGQQTSEPLLHGLRACIVVQRAKA